MVFHFMHAVLVKSGPSKNTQCYALAPVALILDAARHFPRKPPLEPKKDLKSREIGVEVVRPGRDNERARAWAQLRSRAHALRHVPKDPLDWR
jgi:hypothetical protein